TGQRMLRLPLHPRLARVVVAGVDLGVAREACALAAELSEGRRGPPDPRVARELMAAAKNLSVSRKSVANDTLTAQDKILLAILAGHPDRVVRRRKRGSDEVLLSEGGHARLAREVGHADADWLAALDADEGRGGGGG